MKELIGYLIDRTTGLGIAAKPVSFKNLAGAAISSTTTYWQSVDAVTDADGRFRGRFELSPGPINIQVDAGASEKKVRKWDEKAQLGFVWASDMGRIGKALRDGVIDNYLNELAVSIPAGHTIRIATGAAIVNGNVFSIENGNMDIAGTANSNPALNPRLDLVTIRQYNEDAPGQDSGRQEVVVTLGVTQNVAPVTPTGSAFKDYPLAVVSTAYNASTKTVSTDMRTFVNEAPAVPLYDTDSIDANIVIFYTAYTTVLTPNVTGLDPRKTYDGEIHFHANVLGMNIQEEVNYYTLLKLDTPFMAGGAINDMKIHRIYRELGDVSSRAALTESVSFSWPIVGVTGVTSLSLPVQIKIQDDPGSANITLDLRRGYIMLRERK